VGGWSHDFRPTKHTVGMAEAWVPPLHLCESAGRCRLTLSGLTHGDGRTLQEAADDLIAGLLDVVLLVRGGGLSFSTDLPPPDYRLLDFIWELGERVECGEDIRGRVFGSVPSRDAST
jgi:hypothetical protein